jgi:hypothetical protein
VLQDCRPLHQTRKIREIEVSFQQTSTSKTYYHQRPHLEKAIQTYRGSLYFSREIARATYLLSKVLSGLGKGEESHDALEQAVKIRNGQTGVQVKEDPDLGDFDSLVVFWKR